MADKQLPVLESPPAPFSQRRGGILDLDLTTMFAHCGKKLNCKNVENLWYVYVTDL